MLELFSHGLLRGALRGTYVWHGFLRGPHSKKNGPTKVHDKQCNHKVA